MWAIIEELNGSRYGQVFLEARDINCGFPDKSKAAIWNKSTYVHRINNVKGIVLAPYLL